MKQHDKKIGVWLDHTVAHFVDLSKGPAIVETLYSDKESHLRYKGEQGTGTLLGNNRASNTEHHKHNREQELAHFYYKILTDRLRNYDDIYLFGPTPAKEELRNLLKEDKHFAGKLINVEPADHLTENQIVARVKGFFNV